jgi:hypothetical protein
MKFCEKTHSMKKLSAKIPKKTRHNPDSKEVHMTLTNETPQRSFVVALVLSILLGTLGIDRFYLGKVGTGIVKLLTFGGFGIWWLVDVILIATNAMTDKAGRPLAR